MYRAAADPGADDPAFTPVAGDLIGVGAQVDQHLFAQAAQVFNGGSPTSRLASYAATGGGDLALPSGDVARPDGGSAGVDLLYGPDNDPDVDFVRTSADLTPDQTQAGLVTIPFAADQLVAVVSPHSDLSTDLAQASLLDIYDGHDTHVHPYLPPVGSDLRTLFMAELAQLAAYNSETSFTLGADVQDAPEDDPSFVLDDPEAIEPFSQAAINRLPAGQRPTVAYTAQQEHAVYDVVRSADLHDPAVQAVLGSGGFLCATDTRALIESEGFTQLARPDINGSCGKVTQDPRIVLNDQVITQTGVRATPDGYGRVSLLAAVHRADGRIRFMGVIRFYVGNTELAVVPVDNGHASWSGPDPFRGGQTVTADFIPDHAIQMTTSSATTTVDVPTTSTISTSFPTQVHAGTPITGTVTVHLVGEHTSATGAVRIYRGCRLLTTAALHNGSARVTLPALSRGGNGLVAAWKGDAEAEGSHAEVSIDQVGGGSANPLAGCPMGVYRGGLDKAWRAYATSTGPTKTLLGRIALEPRATWFTREFPDHSVRGEVHRYVRNSQHGDPHTLVQLALFRVDPWEFAACRTLPTKAQQRSYKRWIDGVVQGLGSAYAAVVLQPDGPFALCAPHHSTLPSRLVAYAARKLATLPNTTVYIDAGAADWLRDTPATAVRLLEADGIKHARGFALNSTHYDSTARQVTFGARVAQALARAGYPDRHFVVNTAENGRPFKGYTYDRHPTGSSFDNAGVCHTPTQTRCVTLGIPPTTDVASPAWHLSPAIDRLAAKYADGYLWFGRPWLDDQAAPFDTDRALALVHSTPY